MLEEVSLRKKNIEDLSKNQAPKQIEMLDDVFDKAVVDMNLLVIDEVKFEEFRDNLNKASNAGHINGKVFSEDVIEKAKKDLSKLIKVIKIDKRGKKTTVYVKSHADAAEEHIKAAMEHNDKSRQAAKSDDKDSMQMHDELYMKHMDAADGHRDIASGITPPADSKKDDEPKGKIYQRHKKSGDQIEKELEQYKNKLTNFEGGESEKEMLKNQIKSHENLLLFYRDKQKAATKIPTEKEPKGDSETIDRGDVKKLLQAGDHYTPYLLNKQITNIHPDEKLNFDSESLTVGEIKDLLANADKGTKFKISESGDITTIEPEEEKEQPKSKMDLNEGDKVMYHDHTDLISSRGGKGAGVEKRLGEVSSMSHDGSMYIRDEKTGHRMYVKKPERHNIEKVIDKQVDATKSKPDGKYKKSGERSTEHTHTDGTKYAQGDKVKFIGAGGKEMMGEFRHVNKNIHSPKGYAVIRGEDGKLYERGVDKISKNS